jgi:hypothetical protein
VEGGSVDFQGVASDEGAATLVAALEVVDANIKYLREHPIDGAFKTLQRVLFAYREIRETLVDDEHPMPLRALFGIHSVEEAQIQFDESGVIVDLTGDRAHGELVAASTSTPGKALDVEITYNEPLGLTVTRHTYRHFPRASIAFANCDATQSLFHLSTDPPHPPSQGMP